MHILSQQLPDPNNEINFLKGIFRSFSDATDGLSEERKEINWGLGAEYTLNESFKLRSGYYRENPEKGNLQFVSLGLGFYKNNMQFDLAYRINTADFENQLQNTISLSAGIPLNFKSAEEAELEAIENQSTTTD